MLTNTEIDVCFAHYACSTAYCQNLHCPNGFPSTDEGRILHRPTYVAGRLTEHRHYAFENTHGH